MREQVEFKRPTMIAPAPGFTARTMARIQMYERARARRRTLIGAGLLIAAAVAALAVVVLWLGGLAAGLITSPSAFLAVMNTVALAADVLGTLTSALIVSAVAFLQAGTVQLLVYALIVCGLLLVWTRVVGGPFQWLPHTISSGELK